MTAIKYSLLKTEYFMTNILNGIKNTKQRVKIEINLLDEYCLYRCH